MLGGSPAQSLESSGRHQVLGSTTPVTLEAPSSERGSHNFAGVMDPGGYTNCGSRRTSIARGCNDRSTWFGYHRDWLGNGASTLGQVNNKPLRKGIMASIDVDEIRQMKEARDKQRAEAIAWCTVALGEFQAGAIALETPSYTTGHLVEFASQSIDGPVTGIWPILRKGDPDNILIDVLHGAAMFKNGQLYVAGKLSDAEAAASWISAR